MRNPARFWDKHAAGYAKRPVPDETVYQKKLEMTQTYIHPETEILEFGCGTGTTAIHHAPHVRHVLATDISPKMLEIAQGKADAQGITNITFQEKVVEDLDFPAESFDVVLGLSILHLLDNKEAIIADVYKWLKPGGVFVTSTVCLGNGLRIFKWIGPIGRFFGLLPLLRVFTDDELANSIKDAGFLIDHRWLPEGSKAVFIIGKKPA